MDKPEYRTCDRCGITKLNKYSNFYQNPLNYAPLCKKCQRKLLDKIPIIHKDELQKEYKKRKVLIEKTRLESSIAHDSPRIGFIVYFIWAEDTNKVKIGVSRGMPKERLKSCQTGSPVKLRFLGYGPEENIGINEKGLHRKFSIYRNQGEWFTLSQEIQEFFVEKFSNLGDSGCVFWNTVTEAFSYSSLPCGPYID